MNRLILIFLLLAGLACARSEPAEQVTTRTAGADPTVLPLPQGHPEVPADPGAQIPPGHPTLDPSKAPTVPQTIRGTVLEATESAGFVYLRLRTDQGEIWGAVQGRVPSVGDTITLNVVQESENFYSRSLDRTFDRIVFGSIENGAGRI